MVVQTRFFSLWLSISHAKRRPPAAPQRSAHVRGDHPARGNPDFESRFLWCRRFSRFGGGGQSRKRIVRVDFTVERCGQRSTMVSKRWRGNWPTSLLMVAARPINCIQCSRQIVLPFCCCSRRGSSPLRQTGQAQSGDFRLSAWWITFRSAALPVTGLSGGSGVGRQHRQVAAELGQRAVLLITSPPIKRSSSAAVRVPSVCEWRQRGRKSRSRMRS
jgi:hypothetical protein